MNKHAVDHQSATQSGRVKHFMALARTPRQVWHRAHGKPGAARLIHFLRIARGRTA